MVDIRKYNNENIFAKILNGEIPCDKVFENEYVLGFKDINPQAPIHIVVIPKEKFCSFEDFSKHAPSNILTSLIRSIGEIAEKMSLEEGYRIICNTGNNGGQEVPHIHFHLLGGKRLGKIIP